VLEINDNNLVQVRYWLTMIITTCMFGIVLKMCNNTVRQLFINYTKIMQLPFYFPQPKYWVHFLLPLELHTSVYVQHTNISALSKIQCVPLTTEPGISLIILTPMKILQWNLKRSTFVVWEMKRNVSVVRLIVATN